MSSRRTRRQFLQTAGASAGALAGLDELAVAKADDRPNVLLIVVDTLRADHSFGKRARTPHIDALAREGLSFTSFYPEAMPTVPARRSILSGRRVFPFRGWHLVPRPAGRAGAGRRSPTSAPRLRALCTGRGTGGAYVTDNVALAFLAALAARSATASTRFAVRGGQIGGTRGPGRVRPRGAPLAATRDRGPGHLRPDQALPGQRPLQPRRDPSRLPHACSATPRACSRRPKQKRPFALVVDTFEPHEPWTPPRHYLDMYGDLGLPRPRARRRPYYAPVTRYLHGHRGEVLLERMRALYVAEVTMTDRWLGVFLDRFHELKLERDTVVALVSRPRLLSGRLRLHRQDRQRPAPAADQDAADRDRPAPPACRARDQLPRPDPRRRADAALHGRGARAATAWTA